MIWLGKKKHEQQVLEKENIDFFIPTLILNLQYKLCKHIYHTLIIPSTDSSNIPSSVESPFLPPSDSIGFTNDLGLNYQNHY